MSLFPNMDQTPCACIGFYNFDSFVLAQFSDDFPDFLPILPIYDLSPIFWCPHNMVSTIPLSVLQYIIHYFVPLSYFSQKSVNFYSNRFGALFYHIGSASFELPRLAGGIRLRNKKIPTFSRGNFIECQSILFYFCVVKAGNQSCNLVKTKFAHLTLLFL